MSGAPTRPPLFDPQPGSFDDDAGAPRFPRRQSSGRRSGRPRTAAPARSGRGGGEVGTLRRGRALLVIGAAVLILVGAAYAAVGLRSGAAPDALPTAVAASDGAGVDTGQGAAAAPGEDVGEEPDAGASASTAPTVAPAEGIGTGSTPQPTPAAEDATIVAAPEGSAALTPELQRASAFAVQFAHDYLNYDQANPDVRQRELRAYLAPGLDPQLGWDGQGSQLAVLTVAVEAIEAAGGPVVTVAAQVTGRDAPRWVHITVPMARDDQGRLAVVAAPAYVPRPRAGAPAEPAARALDQVLSEQLQQGLTPLFTAFATDADVDVPGVTAPTAQIRGLGGQVALAAVGPLRVFVGDDANREALVEVSWTDDVTGGTLSQTYALDLIAVDGGWLVEGVATTSG